MSVFPFRRSAAFCGAGFENQKTSMIFGKWEEKADFC